MKKKLWDIHYPREKMEKIFLMTKFSLIFLVLSIQLNATAFSQQTRLSLKLENVTMEQLFVEIEKVTDFAFVFNAQDLNALGKVNVDFNDEEINKILDYCFKDKGIEYSIVNNHVVVRKSVNLNQQTEKVKLLKGKVLDKETKDPLPGATIKIKDSNVGTATDVDGSFQLTIPMTMKEIEVSFIGYKLLIINIEDKENVDINLEAEISEMLEIVVNGMFTRKAESFTGSATTFKAEDLKRLGNQNIIQSLKNLDPSFMVMDNVDFGSDPNRMPEIQIRGASSLPNIQGEYQSNPNQPLFILDGFEASTEKVFDLDMNRVASVTLLKDAAAKAIYGSKAANGVVVIETILPEKGALRISYTGDLNITIPDLNSYDLCNASEKLQVELDAGRYSAYYPSQTQELMEQYNEIKRNIERGVNTYWLSKPLQTGVGHKHSLYLEGGDEHLRYGVDLSYNKVVGVMKKSSRENVAGAITLSYRYRNVIFRNTLSVNFNRADDSPYGSFSEYTKLNPYWSTHDENGNLKRLLGQYTPSSGNVINYYNPLYNATIGTKNFNRYTEITDNFYIDWQIYGDLKVIGRFGYTQKQNTREDFYPGNHSKYSDWTDDLYFKRGEYSITDQLDKSLKIDATLNYSKQIENHLLFANLNWSLAESSYDYHGMEAWGFVNDKVDHIAFAKQYKDNGTPSGDEATTREIGIVGALNYSYDNRYLFDFSYRANGSSIYGANNRWGSFWSLGGGWNLHHEKFLKSNIINQLKLRASIGYTGSQNFNPYQAMATYKYFTDAEYDNIIGSYLMALANDDLKWQRTRDLNFGIDADIARRLTFRFDYYISNTDNLLIDLTVPSSTGFNTYKENLGEVENKGFDATLNLKILNDQVTNNYFTVFGSIAHNKNKIIKISDALSRSNEDQMSEDASTKPYTRFEEGQSTSAIWAVRSLGIDPATGREMFLNKSGDITYVWNVNDQVVCGESLPKVRGNFGFNSEYKGVSLNCSFSYRLGGEYYNQTLVDRVENVDIQYNVDRRVFTGTWKEEGDVTFFKKITTTPTKTMPSDRFVEKYNELTLASVNLSYDFKHFDLKKWNLERLKFSFYMTDVFRVSTVKTERGLEYPFARTFSFNLQATF